MGDDEHAWLRLNCGFCGHWKRGQFTKDEVADWLRTHRNALIGQNEGHTTTESTCPHPCGTAGEPEVRVNACQTNLTSPEGRAALVAIVDAVVEMDRGEPDEPGDDDLTELRLRYPPTDSDVYHGAVSGRPYVDAHRERIRAHDKHCDKPGGSMEMKTFDEPDWLAVLVEEVGEVAKVQCDHRHGLLDDDQMRTDLRTELVQVAAMTCAWIDAIDRDRRTRG